jgi:enterochelin esterase-like enzyme/lysophospholipase L1-like esterase
VTFRLRAPSASSVDLVGEVLQGKGPRAMTKAADGVWSVTIGPLPPEIWIYNFRVQGVDLPDPSNISLMPRAAGAAAVSSFVEVSGDAPAFYDARPVPHGDVRMVLYESKAMGVHRSLWVYTPPGYDTSGRTYPVYYLLHGNGETQSGWVANGRANIILDNLIADGRAEPMVVVMPHGHPIQSASVGPFALVPPDGEPGMLNFRLFTRDLLQQIIPLVERSYRVHADAEHRAIGGLSMGGFQSLEIGLAHPELFRYVLAYSGGFGSLGSRAPEAADDTRSPWKELLAKPAETRKTLRLLFLGSGRGETGMLGPGQALVRRFQAQGVNARWSDYPGGHVFSVWRNLLHESAPLLFKPSAETAGALPRATPGPPAAERWVTAWATAQQLAPTRLPFGGRDEPPQPPPAARVPATLKDQTVRMIARTTIGGRHVRIRLTNALEKPLLRVGAAHVAVRQAGATLVPASDRLLTFGGRQSTVVPPGAVVLSDPVDLQVTPLTDLAVSLYLPEDTGLPTIHPDGMHTAYIAAGNAAGQTTLVVSATTTAYLWLSGVDVLAPAAAGTIVAFGDSITDGVAATLDSDRAWPSLLAARLASPGSSPPLGVINLGLSGNRLLRHGFGVSALTRFDRDVLGQAGVRWMTLMLGINDITFPAVPGMPPTEGVTADDVTWGLRQIVERAHQHGIKVAGATIMPVGGVSTYTEGGEAIRQAVNQWIRTSGAYDAVLDFDAVVRDSADPRRLRREYDPGDHVHPNDAGNAAMAASIDVSVFR